MNDVRIMAIVEGHGECEAAPGLIRRIALDIDPGFVPKVVGVQRVSASKLKGHNELERVVEFAARKLSGRGGIIILLDCDDGCPAREGPELLKRAKNARPDMPVSIILAKREYEAWFIAATESEQEAEAVRDAKGWLSKNKNRRYMETTDQAAMTAVFDMRAARSRSDSFDKCYREIFGMLHLLREQVSADGA